MTKNNTSKEYKSIKVLFIEDNLADAQLIEEMLINVMDVKLEWVQCLSIGIDRLSKGGIDIILLDLSLPESQGLDTLISLQAKAMNLPIVILTGLADKDIAIKAVEYGAQDYLIKAQVNGDFLYRSMRYAIYRKKGEKKEKQLLEAFAAAAEEQLKQKIKMEAIIEGMAEGVIMTDEKGELVILNPAAHKMLGFKTNESVTDKRLKAVIENIEKSKLLIRGTDLVEEELYTGIDLSGSQTPGILHASYALVKDRNGEKLGHVTVLRDITMEKKVDKMKTEFISTVSHELRTPLSIIKEGISLVMDEIPGKINEKQARLLKISQDNIDRLVRIINDLLDISKIETGKVELKRELINMKTLLTQVVASFGPLVKEQGLELKVTVPEERIDIYADPDKIIQVLTNLMANALNFTMKGRVNISVREKRDEVECLVADTGIGISKDNLSRVFDKFQQFDRCPNGGTKGTGLGLSIVKRIVEMHKGKIWVESEAGKGTKFTFTLPKYDVVKNLHENIENRVINP